MRKSRLTLAIVVQSCCRQKIHKLDFKNVNSANVWKSGTYLYNASQIHDAAGAINIQSELDLSFFIRVDFDSIDDTGSVE